MTHTVSTKWINNMSFETNIEGHKLFLDATTEHGGDNKGPSPKQLMLSGLTGCSGMDIVNILNKMRHIPKHFNITVDAELSDSHPKYYKTIHITYEFDKSVPEEKAKNAIELSLNKYCSVSHTLKQLADIDYEIKFIE